MSLAAFGAAVLAAQPVAPPKPDVEVTSLDPPAAVGALAPGLTALPGGDAIATWLEPADKRLALRFSRLTKATWSPAQRVVESSELVGNWADTPSLFSLRDGRLAAHWPERPRGAKAGYFALVSISPDGGSSWAAPASPHGDRSETEHGFLSFFELADGRLGTVWLDGRNTAAGGHGPGHAGGVTSLRLAVMGADGKFGPDTALDEQVCDCCQTAAAVTARGPIVAYRDRSDREVRDIAVTRLAGDRWTPPVIVHADGWQVSACPVNGPALAADGDRVVLAWFTAQGDRPRVRAALSENGGASFGRPIEVSERPTVGRVGAAVLADGSAVVSWVEGAAPDTALRLKRLWPDGRTSPAQDVALVSPTHASGYPQLLRSADRLLVSWVEAGPPSKVRVSGVRWR